MLPRNAKIGSKTAVPFRSIFKATTMQFNLEGLDILFP